MQQALQVEVVHVFPPAHPPAAASRGVGGAPPAGRVGVDGFWPAIGNGHQLWGGVGRRASAATAATTAAATVPLFSAATVWGARHLRCSDGRPPRHAHPRRPLGRLAGCRRGRLLRRGWAGPQTWWAAATYPSRTRMSSRSGRRRCPLAVIRAGQLPRLAAGAFPLAAMALARQRLPFRQRPCARPCRHHRRRRHGGVAGRWRSPAADGSSTDCPCGHLCGRRQRPFLAT